MARNIVVMKGNITELRVDAIVAPATRFLENEGSPITKEIFAAAGEGLIKECHLSAPCARNTAIVTRSHNLDCKIIIHAVSTYLQSEFEEALRDLVMHCLELAYKEGCRSIALPFLSVHLGIPSKVVIAQSINAIEESEYQIERIIFVVDTNYQLNIFDKFLTEISTDEEPPKKSKLKRFSDNLRSRFRKPENN